MSAPSPPDPEEVAAAQSASNKETAVAQYELGATNQVTPSGSLTYQQTGTSESGTPTYTATQALTPEQQNIFDIGERTATTLGTTAEQQAQQVQSTLSTPVDLGPSATEDYLFGLGSATLDPYYDQEQEQLTSQLATQGIFLGSEAYNEAMAEFNKSKGIAYDDLMLQGHQTATQDILTERNQPINEMSALMGGSAVSQPSYVTTPQPTVQPTDVAGIEQNAYNAQMAQYNAMMGGLFGIPTAVLGGWAQSGFT